MFEFIKNICRKSAIKKHSSNVATGFLPLDQTKAYVAIIDVEDPSYDACKNAIMSFFRAHNIKGCIFFRDFRKIGSEDRLITSIKTTITRDDVNWFGKPSKEKIDILQEDNPDLFICLTKEVDFTVEFLARASKARFKIGRQQLKGKPFDFVINDPKDKAISEYESFVAIRDFMEKIK